MPISVLVFLTVPWESSKTRKYLGFQKKRQLGFTVLILTTLKLLSRTTTSIGFFIKKVCIPNLVFNITPPMCDVLSMPRSLSEKDSEKETASLIFSDIQVSLVWLNIFNFLYLNRLRIDSCYFLVCKNLPAMFVPKVTSFSKFFFHRLYYLEHLI